jgi:hypothetical protein
VPPVARTPLVSRGIPISSVNQRSTWCSTSAGAWLNPDSDLVVGVVRQKIGGEASGGSDVTYSGTPGSVSVDTSGGAELHHR